MYLEIKEINEEIFNNAISFFSKKYIEEIKKKTTFKESIVARHIIEINKKYFFFSISHKTNLVFVGLNNEKIGIDIEIIRKRDSNLLDIFQNTEYKILGKKSWENFYYLWTSKESMIKFESIDLDHMKNMILKKSEKIEKKISNIIFSKKMLFQYNKQEYVIYSGKQGDNIFSIVF